MLDPMNMLEEIREWVEIETPTGAPDAIARLMQKVAAGFAELGGEIGWIEARDGRGPHLEVRSPRAATVRGSSSSAISTRSTPSAP
ncbi:MAG: hypothetical protein R3C97_07115 [Geminicoccaceae bacterium]